MATRQIKDAKDLSTNELIYFKGHAQATYMSDGSTVEDAINNININGGGGTIGGGAYVSKQLFTTTSSSMTLQSNVYYRNTSTSLSTLTITLASASDNTILNEYFVEFTTRSSGTTVSLPSSIKWANGVTPTFENGKTYQISIVNNLGTCVKFG